MVFVFVFMEKEMFYFPLLFVFLHLAKTEPFPSPPVTKNREEINVRASPNGVPTSAIQQLWLPLRGAERLSFLSRNVKRTQSINKNMNLTFTGCLYSRTFFEDPHLKKLRLADARRGCLTACCFPAARGFLVTGPVVTEHDDLFTGWSGGNTF